MTLMLALVLRALARMVLVGLAIAAVSWFQPVPDRSEPGTTRTGTTVDSLTGL